MEYAEVEKSKAIIVLKIIEYEQHSVVTKTIINTKTGSICVMSFDEGEALVEKISPFDSFAQIIDGEAEIVIFNNSYSLKTGQSIIIPANTPNIVKANEQFKMILTVIRNT